ncbi:MAG: EamA family transporter [Planctomycetota bacterium]
MIPSWILLAIFSAGLLGIYDAAKKSSVKDNAVPPVLMSAVCIGGGIWAMLLLAQWLCPSSMFPSMLLVDQLALKMHAAILLKALIVGVSWTLAYFSLKTLPLSIAGPMRAMGPVWTIVLATTLLGERPTTAQWLGIALVMFGFMAMSRVGRREGIDFRRDRGVLAMFVATIVGACSGLYDKLLLQQMELSVPTVQAWFSIYLVLVISPLWLYWWMRDRERRPFRWRNSVIAIAVFLLAADFVYFAALANPQALVSIVSPIRRLAAVVSFLIAAFFFGDKNIGPKSICVAFIAAGILVIGWGSQ